MNYIVIEIGCLECDIGSSLVGRFETQLEADQFATENNNTHGSDVRYQVFDLREIVEITS